MKLTEKQKNCPYCHLDFDVWTDEYSSGFSYIDSDFPGHWYVETKICAKILSLKHVQLFIVAHNAVAH